jgi:FkbM family methyltransferase
MRSAPLWLSASASAIRALPFGRYRAANAIARIPCGPFRARLPRDLGGAAFVCDVRDSIAREAFFTGRYEPQETVIFNRLVDPGSVVVDVGANWGYFTLLAADRAGRDGRVFALEPNPNLFGQLRANVDQNGYGNVTCLALAASDREGDLPFIGDVSAGNSGLSRCASATEPPDFVARGVTLDSLLDHAGIERVRLVKLDVEGGESMVLAGMQRGIERRRYDHVLLEFHPWAFEHPQAAFDRCVCGLVDAGYTGLQIDHTPDTHRRAARGTLGFDAVVRPLSAGAALQPWSHTLWSARP